MGRDVWEDEPEYTGRIDRPVNRLPVADKMRQLEDELRELKRNNESAKQTKAFKFPFKWNWRFTQAKKRANLEKVLIMFLNKKNEIEMPTFVPIYSGNIVIYRNKAYEFDPRGIWRLKGVKGYPSVYLIREIDRRPLTNPVTKKYVRDVEGRVVYGKDAAVSNMDIDDVRERGDSTESDEFLIKAALKAYTATKTNKPVNWLIIGVVVVIVIVAAVFLMRSNLGA